MSNKILITGGSGFIGSHVVRLFLNEFPNSDIYNLDDLTYAGNKANLNDIEGLPNYRFIKMDIKDSKSISELFDREKFDKVIHLAAESHVDRSISEPNIFLETNVIGTANLLNAFKESHINGYDDSFFYHISTDEVYGSLGKEGYFIETTPYDPQSPYSASKASSDHIVRAYYNTYGLPIKITNCSNNYGPNQFPEKLIPLCINNILQNKPLPIYGDGKYTRDWLYVKDHANAILSVFKMGAIGETYNIGGFNEWTNIDLVNLLCKIMDQKLGRKAGDSAKLITFVTNRPGHDRRYAIDATKIQRQLGWSPSITFEEGLEKTVDWYLENLDWVEDITSGKYQDYYKQQYDSK